METKWFYPSRGIFNNSMRNADSWKYASVGKIFSFLVSRFFPEPYCIIFLFVNIKKNTFLGAPWEEKVHHRYYCKEMKAAWGPLGVKKIILCTYLRR